MEKQILTIAEAFEHAEAHIGAGDLDPAESIYRNILAKAPQNLDAELGLAHVLKLRSRSLDGGDLSVPDILPPLNARDRQQLDSLFREEKFEELERLTRDMLTQRPQDLSLHVFLGAALLQQNKLEGAVISYLKAIEIRPPTAPAHFGAGIALSKMEKFGDAITGFRNVIALEPDNTAAWSHLADAQKKMGDLKSAGASYWECLTRAPDHMSFHSELLKILTKTGDVETGNRWATEHGLPFMQRLASQGIVNAMASLVTHYFLFLKIQDTEEQYAQFCVPPITLFYKTVRDDLSLRPAEPRTPQPPSGKKRRVAFFAETVTQLAHTRNLFNYTRAIAQRPDLDIEPILYYGTAGNERDISQYHDIGISTHHVPNIHNVKKAGFWLRDHLKDNNIDTLVVLGTISGIMAFLFGIRAAPVQIWWSQKYHGLDFDNIDGYLTLGGFEPTREIQGRTWRCVPGLFGPEITAPLKDPAMAEVRRLRQDLLGARFTRIAGVIGREEKLDNDEYWDCVAEVLSKHPEFLFIWSGRAQRDTIQRRIEVRGLADRCRFLGWVDTGIYANVVDLYLDSFPFPGGHTLIQAMMAGKPAVSLVTKEALRIGIPIFAGPWLKKDGGDTLRRYGFEPIFTGPDGEDLLPFVADTQTYVARALALIENPAFQARWTAASRQFVEQYLTDMKRPADMLNMHILDVIRDRERLLKDS